MMLRYIFLVLGFVAIVMAAQDGFAAGKEKKTKSPPGRTTSIAVVVNQDAISGADVQDRLHLILVSSGMPDTPDMRQRVLPQVLDALIEEQLKLQEGKRLGVVAEPEEIKQGFSTIAEQNKFTIEQFENLLKHQGVSKATMTRQIETQIIWGKVVQNQIRPRITVSPNDVDARKKRLQDAMGKTEYLVSEIYLPVSHPSSESDVRQLAEKIYAELTSPKNPAPFAAVAAQFSKGAGAADKGGSIGWVQGGQLAKELDDVLETLGEGQISRVIRSASGYHLLQMNKKRTLVPESIPTDDDILNQIGMERLVRAQARYLDDLKAAAFIERKI